MSFARTLILSALIAPFAGCATSPEAHRVGAADAPPPPLPNAIESGELRAEPGFVGDRLGVRILGVTDLADESLQAVDLDVPLDSDRIDRVEIVSPRGQPIEQPKEAEIKSVPGPENAGIRIYLPNRKGLEFRIKLIDDPDQY